MQNLIWPVELCPRAAMFHPQSSSRSGGQSFTGTEQVVTSPGGRWMGRITYPIHTDLQVLAHHALMASLEGRSGTAFVPVFDGRRAPRPRSADGREITPGRQQGDPSLDPSIRFRVTTAAALNATSLVVALENGTPPQPGQHFSIDGRLHRIRTATPFGGVYTLNIWPWLRAAVPVGTMPEFWRPVCRMRLASDDEGQADLDMLRFADVTLNFVEAF